MPILPAEPAIFPSDLFHDGPKTVDSSPVNGNGNGNGDGEHDEKPRWWCLHTKPRQEKATARYLRERNLAHYLPQITRESHTPGGRKIRSVVPLFPSYLFLKGDRHARREAFRGSNLVNVLEVEDQPQIDRDLRQIHQMLSSGLPVVPEPDYPVGTRVRILSGPLEGLIGTVVRKGNSDRFVAMVHFLGRGAMVALESWQIEPVGD